MLLQKVIKNHDKKMELAYRKSIKTVKRRIKYTIKNGEKYCYFDIDDIQVYGYSRNDEEQVYAFIIPLLKSYYNGDVIFALDYHGFNNTHLRVMAKIVQ